MTKPLIHPVTEKLIKKQKHQSKQARQNALQWLAATFPNAFDTQLSIHPLKIGILQDILAHADQAAQQGISKSKLREAVVQFTRSIDYLTCLKARETRIDLQGNPTVPVTEEEASLAAIKIRKHIDNIAAYARKEQETQTALTNTSTSLNKSHGQSYYEKLPPVSDNPYEPTTRPNTVIIKHKSTKQLDPEAVARLKEKLGLSSSRGACN